MIEDNTNFWANLTFISAFAAGVISFLARQWFNLRQLFIRVEKLEAEEKKMMDSFMTKEELLTRESACRKEMYSDIKSLDDKIDRIYKNMEAAEICRNAARKEDSKWKKDIGEAVVEIKTIVKERERRNGQHNVS